MRKLRQNGSNTASEYKVQAIATVPGSCSPSPPQGRTTSSLSEIVLPNGSAQELGVRLSTDHADSSLPQLYLPASRASYTVNGLFETVTDMAWRALRFAAVLLSLGFTATAQEELPVVDLGYRLQRASSFNVSDYDGPPDVRASSDMLCSRTPSDTTTSPTSDTPLLPLAIFASRPLSLPRRTAVPFTTATTRVESARRLLELGRRSRKRS